MREIKFRGWDKDQKIMYLPEHNEIRYMTVESLNAINSLWVLMQYTGLKDKNGKEIYEGDKIVAWSEGIKAIGEVVQRIDGLWIIYPAWQKDIMWGLCPNEKGETTVEIIGNIYENPELLEVDQ